MALLLVNLGQSTQQSYKLPASHAATDLAGKDVRVRDVWAHEDVAGTVGHGGAFEFRAVKPHDSVFYVLHPA